MMAAYRLNFDALKAAMTHMRLVIGGSTATQEVGYQGALAVAERLGQPVVEFPGNHAGFVNHPLEFVASLRSAFGL